MEDWVLLDRTENERREAQKQALWHALEHDQVLPDPAQLEHLSGLLDEDIARIEAVLLALPLDRRRELVRTLLHTALADFKMDFTAIFRIAARDADADVRAAAVEGLFEVEDVRLVPLFVEMLHGDPSEEVRALAAQALGGFVLLGELGKIRPGPFEAAMTALCDRHTDPTEAALVQCRAIESLAYTSDRDVPRMIARAYTEGDAALRLSALFAMGRSADRIWGDIVRRELSNPQPAMRLEATRACGELQLREAAKDVAEMTEDVDANIRLMAIWSLGQIGGNLARKTLQRCTRSDDQATREAAEEALQELEFYYGDLGTFFGAPSEFDGETDGAWRFPTLADLPEGDDDVELYGLDAEDEDELDDGDDLYLFEEDDEEDLDGLDEDDESEDDLYGEGEDVLGDDDDLDIDEDWL